MGMLFLAVVVLLLLGVLFWLLRKVVNVFLMIGFGVVVFVVLVHLVTRSKGYGRLPESIQVFLGVIDIPLAFAVGLVTDLWALLS